MNFFNSRYFVKGVNSYRSRLEYSPSRISMFNKRLKGVHVMKTVEQRSGMFWMKLVFCCGGGG